MLPCCVANLAAAFCQDRTPRPGKAVHVHSGQSLQGSMQTNAPGYVFRAPACWQQPRRSPAEVGTKVALMLEKGWGALAVL